MEDQNQKRNWKQEVKEVWNEYRVPIKVGCWCLLIGGVYGFVKGVKTEGNITGAALTRLIEKIPQQPELDDIDILDFLSACDREALMETLELMGMKVTEF